MINVKIVADSISPAGVRLVTFVLEYPRAIHGELMTHRVFSRNAASSRAIPMKDVIERVEKDGWTPEFFGKKKAGMQDGGEWKALLSVPIPCIKEQENYTFTGSYTYDILSTCWQDMTKEEAWNYAKSLMIPIVQAYDEAGYHKQIPNRLLEPFQYMQTIVTGTEWDNFFELRISEAAEPHFNKLATLMKVAMDNSNPELLEIGDYHLPFITDKDYFSVQNVVDNSNGLTRQLAESEEILLKVSVARCARVSYGLNERLTTRDIEDDLKLYQQLLDGGHMSPFEHVAAPMITPYLNPNAPDFSWMNDKGITHMDKNATLWSANFKGWLQYRQLI